MPGIGAPPGADATNPMAPPPDASTPPLSSPMSTPEPKMGSKEAAMINLGMAQDLLEQSYPLLGLILKKARLCWLLSMQSTRLLALARTKQTNCSNLRSFRCYKPSLKLVAQRQRARLWLKRRFLAFQQWLEANLNPQCKEKSWICSSPKLPVLLVVPQTTISNTVKLLTHPASPNWAACPLLASIRPTR